MRKKPIHFKVKGRRSRSLGLYKEIWHLNPCGQDIARTMQLRLLRLSMYTSYEKRKKPNYFQGQISRSLGFYKKFRPLDLCGQDIARNMQTRLLKLICTLHMERGRSLFIFKVNGPISRSLGLYKEFWYLDPCG